MEMNVLQEGIPLLLPDHPGYDQSVPHAPKRIIENSLSLAEKQLAVRNALRYFPQKFHEILAKEFAEELTMYGRIYMYRFRPQYDMFARSISEYPAQSNQAAAIMLMIQNNLDPKVAKYPHELITYGGNGAVFQNWAQYLLTMRYLSQMTDFQTLVLYSGHPLGLFPSHPDAPRVVVSNGMMIPNYSKKEDWNKYNALGVTQYGQMTAGSFMYIGPQGIVHGTTITLLNAARRFQSGLNNLQGQLFITSGLGGMSGAQSLAAVITGACCILAEVDPDAIQQRVADGYIDANNIYTSLTAIFEAAKKHSNSEKGIALVYAGNIVNLWEYAANNNIQVHLGSDQTSLHNIDDLGYCPVGYSFAEAKELLTHDKETFMKEVQSSLRRQVDAINILSQRGMYFWDYGNAFLKEAGNAGASVWKDSEHLHYKYPSYVEDIMGPLCFDYGFGPFRWVCCSGLISDLEKTDKIAEDVIKELLKDLEGNPKLQYQDNLKWIQNAAINLPVVGSISRILYADAHGRIAIAKAFNQAIANNILEGPVVLGRDHHDVSGTDSPFRETSNIYDGSKFTADMAIHNVIGDSFRGATWVSIHNGGGVGWGEVINGGFGMVLDGSKACDIKIQSMLHWDVNNGVARRAWARNKGAVEAIQTAMSQEPLLQVSLPNAVKDSDLENLF
ncbi:MAG: urocanate hydratase [Saprospiraceae bacterium]|nr:urocanate hydratase [Saprospiraceae bacterium]HRG68116.1 urocanate hydratase [Saprospiraceae bacterium]